MIFYFKFVYVYFLIASVNCDCKSGETCIPKCCGVDEVLVEHKCSSVVKASSFKVQLFDGTNPIKSRNNIRIIEHKMCENAAMLTDFYAQSDGKLFLSDTNEYFDFEEYCLENNYETEYDRPEFIALWCFEPQDVEEPPPVVFSSGMIISMPFLLATFIAYALLPDRNLHMKALMFYVITLMISYLLLVIVQLTKSRFEDTVCTLIGYFCLFFFLVSFFWMNVICIDIWFAFSGLRGFSGSKKIAERKRFFIYCAYAWGMPIIHVLIIFAIQSLSSTVQWYNPAIGEGQCFLKRGYAELIYFYGPMAFLIGINIIFFAITALKIRSVKKDTSMLKNEDNKRHSYENDKQTFNLYLKLLFAMGVNWSMEIISWAVIWANVAPDWIWYLTDFCNAIYGVFIFFIFVFKKSIWKLLKKRYYSFMGRSHLAHSMASTNATRTTSYSTANTMHDNPHGGGLHDTSTLTSEA